MDKPHKQSQGRKLEKVKYIYNINSDKPQIFQKPNNPTNYIENY